MWGGSSTWTLHLRLQRRKQGSGRIWKTSLSTMAGLKRLASSSDKTALMHWFPTPRCLEVEGSHLPSGQISGGLWVARWHSCRVAGSREAWRSLSVESLQRLSRSKERCHRRLVARSKANVEDVGVDRRRERSVCRHRDTHLAPTDYSQAVASHWGR